MSDDKGVASWSPKPKDRNDPITVGELIRLLQNESPDSSVMVEGCDCEGAAAGISNSEGVILITRVRE